MKVKDCKIKVPNNVIFKEIQQVAFKNNVDWNYGFKKVIRTDFSPNFVIIQNQKMTWTNDERSFEYCDVEEWQAREFCTFYSDWYILVCQETMDVIEEYLDILDENYLPIIDDCLIRAKMEEKDCYFTSDNKYAFLNKQVRLSDHKLLTAKEFNNYVLKPFIKYNMAKYPGTIWWDRDNPNDRKQFRVKNNSDIRNAFYSVVKHKFPTQIHVNYEFEEGSPIYNLLDDLRVLNIWCEEVQKQQEMPFGSNKVIIDFKNRMVTVYNGKGDTYTIPFSQILKLAKYLYDDSPTILNYPLQFDSHSTVNFGCIEGQLHELNAIFNRIEDSENKK
ncbi:MAG: hypothetical protein ACOC4J_06420 [Bacteroidota bacterium]